jgi:hypothetical protein
MVIRQGLTEQGDTMALPKGIDGRGRVMKGGNANTPFKTNDQPSTRELRRKEERRQKKLKKDGRVE